MAGDSEETWVEVVEHDPAWAAAYEREATVVAAALGAFAAAVEHFGSTSVPGLAAKPVVDVMVGTTAVGVPAVIRDTFAGLGYEFLGEDGRRPGRFFWRKRHPAAFNVSVVPHGGVLWTDNLDVRDFLRAHPGWVTRYAEVKRRAASASPGSLDGYQDGKRGFLDELRLAARKWAGPSEADGPAGERR